MPTREHGRMAKALCLLLLLQVWHVLVVVLMDAVPLLLVLRREHRMGGRVLGLRCGHAIRLVMKLCVVLRLLLEVLGVLVGAVVVGGADVGPCKRWWTDAGVATARVEGLALVVWGVGFMIAMGMGFLGLVRVRVEVGVGVVQGAAPIVAA